MAPRGSRPVGSTGGRNQVTTQPTKTCHSTTRRWERLRHRGKGGRHHLRANAERAAIRAARDQGDE